MDRLGRRGYSVCMNRWALFLLTCVFAIANTQAASPVVADPEVFDFGEIEQGSPVTARFRLRNVSENTVDILLMEFSDPALLAMVNPRLAAGSSVEARAYWNTSGLLGDVTGRVTLTFVSSEIPALDLVIRGRVTRPEPESPD